MVLGNHELSGLKSIVSEKTLIIPLRLAPVSAIVEGVVKVHSRKKELKQGEEWSRTAAKKCCFLKKRWNR